MKRGKRNTKAPLDAGARRRFQQRLLNWYRANQRNLPWRNTTDPYKILVSEIMLQQTQVDRVIPKYEEFLQKYPTLEVLAQAPVEEVRKTWYPLVQHPALEVAQYRPGGRRQLWRPASRHR